MSDPARPQRIDFSAFSEALRQQARGLEAVAVIGIAQVQRAFGHAVIAEQEQIGREIEVLVDAVDEEGTIARSSADAPEIDGLVLIDNHFDAEPGDFLRVRVVDADEHDLYAEVVADGDH